MTENIILASSNSLVGSAFSSSFGIHLMIDLQEKKKKKGSYFMQVKGYLWPVNIATDQALK